MGKRCSLKLCRNSGKTCTATGLTFHRLPIGNEMRQLWLNAVPPNSLALNTKHSYICSEHFTADSFQPESLGLHKRMLKKTAYPTIFNYITKDGTKTKHTSFFIDDEDSASDLETETDPLAIETQDKDEKLLFGSQDDDGCQTDTINRKNSTNQHIEPQLTSLGKDLAKKDDAVTPHKEPNIVVIE